MIKASAPGKCIIIGEHAVVYGEPAIIAAIGKRAWVEAKKADTVKIISRNMNARAEWTVGECIDFAVQCRSLWMKGLESKDFSELFRKVKDGQNFKKVAVGMILHRIGVNQGVELTTYGDIPVGSGLGSSSALAVALTKAITELFEKGLPDDQINKISLDIEKMVHGTPSGGDNTASTYGGLIWFQKDERGRPHLEPLKDEIPYKLENFVLTFIKKPAKTTGQLVQMVRNLDPELRDSRVKAIGEASKDMRKALREKDFPRVKQLINLTWSNLHDLGLSIPEADDLIAKIGEIGGAAKLCGACGGGILLAYHEDKKALKKVIRDAGYQPFETELGADGVRLE